MNQFLITVIMPALNEELCLNASVANVLNGFRRFAVHGELIIVDDGSSDRTGVLAEEWSARHDYIRVLHHGTPQGIGASFWDGQLHARGEIVVMIPGDGENDATEILRYLHYMDQVDIIVPFVSNPGVRPWSRRLLSFTYHQIIYITTALSLNYLNGTVLYRKTIFEGITLKSRGFFYQTELLLKTIGRDYLYAEVPYVLNRRSGGRSKATTFRSLVEVVRAYCATMLDIYPLIRRNMAIMPDSVTAKRMREITPAPEAQS